MCSQSWGSISITVTCVPRVGLDTSCNGPSITPSIINWMCMDSITGTSPGGIACSAPFEKQMASLPGAGFPTLMSATWEACSLFEMNTERP